VQAQQIDLLTINAHKIHGPKGIGALYIRKGTRINAWQHGGDQEWQKRAGTENVPAIVGFGQAASRAMQTQAQDIATMTELRDKLITGILKIPHVRLNGPTGNKRLCNNANFSFKGIEGEAIGGYLDMQQIYSSTGSACASKSLDPSHVLSAMGLTHEECNGSLRLTISKYTTQEDIDKTIHALPAIVNKLRELSPVGKVN